MVFEKSLHKELVMMPRGFEVLKMIQQFPKVLTKLGFEFLSGFLENFEVKICTWPLYVWKIICLKFWSSILKGSLSIDSEGQNGHFLQNQSKSRLTKWTFGKKSIQWCTFHISIPFGSLDQKDWGLGWNLFLKKP